MKMIPTVIVLDAGTLDKLDPAVAEVADAIRSDERLAAIAAAHDWPVESWALGFVVRRLLENTDTVDVLARTLVPS